MFISWENEAYLLEKEFGGKVGIVYPSLSILAEPPVAVVDKNVERKGTRAVAQAYLEYLYSDEQAFGGWANADKEHFADGASFNQIYLKK